MAIRAVLFDFGDTVVEGVNDLYSAFHAVFAELGIPLPPDAWAAADRAAWEECGPRLYTSLGERPSFWDQTHAVFVRKLGLADDDGRLVAALHERATSPALHRPFPETIPVLDHLARAGIPVHLVSNSTDYLPETLARLGWTDRFASVTYSQEAGAEKPDRRVFELALRRAKVRPDEAMFVGNSWEADYCGARRAGLRAVWLNRRGAPPPEPCESVPDLWGAVRLVFPVDRDDRRAHRPPA